MVLNNGKVVEGKFPRVHKNGKEIWIEGNYSPIKDEKGRVTGVVELAKDITVGDINDGAQMIKTSLYSHEQYKAVDAKTWDSKVFIKN